MSNQPSKAFAEELRGESATTRRMLERLPADRLAWKPHEKSTSLGRLAGHITQLPVLLAAVLTQDELNFDPEVFDPAPMPESVPGLLKTFDKNTADAIGLLNTLADDKLNHVWRLRAGEQVFMEKPRAAVIRWVFSHIIHHRGQLSVYLRLLDVPLPPVYGPTADES
jgi:uncharacterized damage-inducible protein DinB